MADMSTLIRRLDAIEAACTPLQRAYVLVERGIPPEAWPDAELNAYCETLPPEIRALSDEELEALLEGHGYAS
jgi:hypothetical protein